MFTGIVEDLGVVKSVEKKGTSGRITVESGFGPGALATGDSIAVDGVCLTVVEYRDGLFSAEISGETLGNSTLGGIEVGSRVNLERPLTPSKPLGGHIVTGHIDCTGTIRSRHSSDDGAEFEITVPRASLGLIVHKGSVAVDGVSLTVASLTGDGFRVAVIPHTLKTTTLSLRRVGSRVNIETDIIARYVERLISSYRRTGITQDFLAEHGFLKKD